MKLTTIPTVAVILITAGAIVGAQCGNALAGIVGGFVFLVALVAILGRTK